MGRPQTLRKSLPGLRRTANAMWPYLRRHRAMMGGSLLSLLAVVALNLLEPWPLKFVFDRVLDQGQGGRLGRIPALEGLDSMEILAVSAIALVVIVGLRALADYFSTVSFALIGNRVLTEVRDDLFRHLQRLPLSFHTKRRGGDLIVQSVAGEHAADIVVSDADYAHTERDLLEPADRQYSARYWDSRTYAPSAFLLYMGVSGDVPDLAGPCEESQWGDLRE